MSGLGLGIGAFLFGQTSQSDWEALEIATPIFGRFDIEMSVLFLPSIPPRGEGQGAKATASGRRLS